MNEFKELIKKQLLSKRPNLSTKSVDTYASTLANLPKKLGKEMDMDIFSNIDDIVEYLKDTPSNKRKSILSAVFVLTENEDARELMLEDSKIVNEHYKQQKKSSKETENWVEWGDVVSLYNSKLRQANLIFKKKLIQEADLEILNEFVILSCYVLFPPRRLMDYAEMQIRNFDIKTDNCISAKTMTFNNYKTKKSFGTQTFQTPGELAGVLKKWSTVNPSDYLIYNKKNKPTTPSSLTKQLNSIFGGKNISVDMIRHSYLTNFYSGTMPTLVEMEELSKKMAHSVQTALTYIKK